MSTTTKTSAPASVLAVELPIVLKPLNDFLTVLQQPGVNVEAAAQDYAALQLAEIQNAPVEESVAINEVSAILQAKLATLVPTINTTMSTGGAVANSNPAPIVATVDPAVTPGSGHTGV